MNFEAHLGYRVTGKLFVSKIQNQEALLLLKAIIEQSEDIHHFFDVDSDSKYKHVAVVFDIKIGGTTARKVFSAVERLCAHSHKVSTIAITPVDTMQPELFKFARGNIMRKHNREHLLEQLRNTIQEDKPDIEYVKSVLEILAAAVDRSMIHRLITATRPLRNTEAANVPNISESQNSV